MKEGQRVRHERHGIGHVVGPAFLPAAVLVLYDGNEGAKVARACDLVKLPKAEGKKVLALEVA